jgi:GNAT superfamily N-acetyltransferase
MTDPRIVSEPRGGAEDATFVRDGLALFNVAVTGEAYYSPLAIFLKDERGAVLGGALGHVWGGWLDLDTLWVAEPFRGQGYGAKLLSAAEKMEPLPNSGFSFLLGRSKELASVTGSS